MLMESVPRRPIVAVVDGMDFRRALVISFFKDWAVAENVCLLSFTPSQAHDELRGGMLCKLIVFSAGPSLLSSPETLAEIKALRELAPSASLIVLTEEENQEHVFAAEGYFSNHSCPDLALRAIRFVLAGGTVFSGRDSDADPFAGNVRTRTGSPISATEGEGAALMPDLPDPGPASLLADLSDRQKAILEHLCKGEPNKAIGRALNIPESTVKVHVRGIMRKLAASNRTQVAIVASRGASGRLHQDSSHGR